MVNISRPVFKPMHLWPGFRTKMRSITGHLPSFRKTDPSSFRRMFANRDSNHEEFYKYTSGRWLWDEQSQLDKRYRRFNISELKKTAAEAVGARECTSISKLAEGSFNKVFRLTMDDGRVVIARIPNPNAGPAYKTTASEVATMELTRIVLNIPVPKVLSWSGEATNPVQSEYILMEEAPGTQLGEVWDGMRLDDKLKIVEDIVAIERKFPSLSFTRYGSLYFAEDAFLGCDKAEVLGEVSQSVKDMVQSRYVIGPVVDRSFWDRERATMNIDRGPWKTQQDYLRAIGKREIAWLRKHAIQKPPTGLFATSEAQRSPEAHIALYEQFLNVSEHLLPKGDHAKATLWHWDIHASNLFVHGGHIVSLIDWQDTWIGPLFLQAQHLRLVDYNGELTLKLPENFADVTDREEKARLRTQIERSIILWIYEARTKSLNPILHDIFHIPHGRTRKDTVHFAENTWDGDIILIRQCLIRVARHWNEINSTIPCPIHFSTEELDAHIRDGEGWNDNADFWDGLQGFVQRDGWVKNGDYEEARDMFAGLREQGLKDLEGEERRAFEEGTRWAVRKT